MSKLKNSKLFLIIGLLNSSFPPDRSPRIGNIKDKLNASSRIVNIDKNMMKKNFIEVFVPVAFKNLKKFTIYGIICALNI